MGIRYCLEAQHASVEIANGSVLTYMVMQFPCQLFACLPSEGSRQHTLHQISADHPGVSRSEWDLLQTLSQCVPLPPCSFWKGDVLHRGLSISVSVRTGQREDRVLSVWEAPTLSSLAGLFVICVLLKLIQDTENDVTAWCHKDRQIMCQTSTERQRMLYWCTSIIVIISIIILILLLVL